VVGVWSNWKKSSSAWSILKLSTPVEPTKHSRGWLIAGGVLSIFVGFLAMGSPLFFSVVLAQFLGIFALVSGVISLFVATFGKQVTHRLLEGLLALIRIIAGTSSSFVPPSRPRCRSYYRDTHHHLR
jgi:uncharacterized membrane protein HdeD (DUF308 family)